MHAIRKYDRTPHLESSRLQAGDEDVNALPFAALRGRHLVVEEKVDGQNSGISFDNKGQLYLQSRGHYLRGGPRERTFQLLKQFAACHQTALYETIGDQYIIYGEWCLAKHTMFYDALPHYFLEFDVFDRARERFLSTVARRRLLQPLPLVSVPVLAERPFAKLSELLALVGPSFAKSARWREALRESAAAAPHNDVERSVRETDTHDAMEGLYIKVEDDEHVLARCKWVRPTFLQSMVDSDSHWFDRPIVENGLRPGVSLFAAPQETP